MIITKIKGGLGNQLFQYAFGYALAQKHNTLLKLDLSWFKQDEAYYSHPGRTKRNFELPYFKITASEIAAVDVQHFRNRITAKIRNRFCSTYKKAIVKEQGLVYNNHNNNNIADNTYVEGFWHDERYFARYKEQLIKEFTIKNAATGLNKAMIEKINGVSTSVSIHIRRGDLAYQPTVTALHGVVDVTYYQAAINYIKTKITTPHFFLFTDDWQWAKIHFPESDSLTHVNINTADNSYEDLRLMYSCKHNIIANSTFSWWGAWLNNNPEKIIIAPERWYADEIKNNEVKNLVPATWKKI